LINIQKTEVTITSTLSKISELKEELEDLYKEDNDFCFWLSTFKEEYTKTQTFNGIKIENKNNISFESLRFKDVTSKNLFRNLFLKSSTA